MERHHVGFPQQRVIVDRPDPMGQEMRGRHIGVVGDDAVAPGRQQLRHPGADASEADEADGLARKIVGLPAAHIVGEVGEFPPFAVAHIGIALADLLEQGQHEGHRGLGDAEAIGFRRRVADHDAELGGGVGIDVVDPDGVFGDDAQPLRGLHDPPRDGGVAHGGAHQGDRIARRFGHCIFVGAARQLPIAIAEDELTTEAFERRDGLRWLFARGEDQNFRLGHGYSETEVGAGYGWCDRCEAERRAHSSWMPLSLKAFSQRTASLRKKASSSSGVLLAALMPAFCSLP